MGFVQPDSTFLIPLLRSSRAPGALPEFVGDGNNEALKYFMKPESMRSSDWPLVLFGQTGTGKTELAHSIIMPDGLPGSAKPVYQTAIEFSRLFKSAVDTDSTRDFRLRYMKSALVVIDDLHHFSRFPAAQQELVYVLDQLAAKGTPVITTSNRPVQLVDGLMPQLASRLLGGLCVDLKPPGPDARQVIINRLAAVHEMDLDPGLVGFLANRLPVTVPKIRQFFVQFLAQRSGPAGAPVAQDELAAYFDQLKSYDREKLADLIIQSVAREFKLSPADIKGSSRKQTTALARSVSIYLHRSLLLMSFAKIGSYYGGRDHSTIMHAYKKVLAFLGDDRNDNVPRARTLKLESQLNEIFAVNV